MEDQEEYKSDHKLLEGDGVDWDKLNEENAEEGNVSEDDQDVQKRASSISYEDALNWFINC